MIAGPAALRGCRGVLVLGSTNTARTLMAEAFLRARLGDAVAVLSCGRDHVAGGGEHSVVHPMARAVMADRGLALDSATYTAKGRSAIARSSDFDVVVSVADTRRLAPKPTGESVAVAEVDDDVDAALCDPTAQLPGCMQHGTPPHFAVTRDGNTTRRQWHLWSPRDKTVNSEHSLKKLSDHYRGEPLFYTHRPLHLRPTLQEDWAVPDVVKRRPMERETEHRARFLATRDDIEARADDLVRRMIEHYSASVRTQTAVVVTE